MDFKPNKIDEENREKMHQKYIEHIISFVQFQKELFGAVNVQPRM